MQAELSWQGRTGTVTDGTTPDVAVFVLWVTDLFVRRTSAAVTSGG